jgi:putative transposase
MSYGI